MKHAPVLLTALCAAALSLSGCSKPAPADEPIRAVKVLSVGLAGAQARTEFSGEVRARIESRLGFRVAGKLLRRQVEVGQRVRAGQLLAELDPQDYQLALAAAQAAVAAASTNRDLAAADYQRYAALKAQNFIGAAELERRETTLKAAQAQLDQARSQASVQGNQATYTRLQADAAGVVTAVEAEPGQVLAVGAPVLRLAHDGPRDLVFAVSEDQISRLRVGMPVAVWPWNASTAITAQLRELAASADPVTRTFAVKAALPSTAALALGSTANLVLGEAAGAPGATLIKLPTTTLRQEGQHSAVWLLDTASMTVKLQPVRVATADGNQVVIASGLQPGQQVVVTGVHLLTEGQKVSIYQEKLAVAPVAAAQGATKKVADSVPVPAQVLAVPAAASAQAAK